MNTIDLSLHHILPAVLLLIQKSRAYKMTEQSHIAQ